MACGLVVSVQRSTWAWGAPVSWWVHVLVGLGIVALTGAVSWACVLLSFLVSEDAAFLGCELGGAGRGRRRLLDALARRHRDLGRHGVRRRGRAARRARCSPRSCAVRLVPVPDRAGSPHCGPTLRGMLRRLDLRSAPLPGPAALRGLLPRAEVDVDAVVTQVRPIVEAVRERGVEAVLEFAERFDRVRPTVVRVPVQTLNGALAALDPAVRAALEVSIERARQVHADQRRTDVTTQVVPGGTVTERFVPVRRVGLYAPGGLAVYPSSVVMNVVPAQEAGVESLVLASPPQAEHGGLPHPTILAAAALLGVDEVWAVGGAQAVALLAYGGTDTDGAELEPVDMVTGPGNVYVTAAKRLLRGLIGIDSEAGTTEIAVLADDTADPVHVAADLISQAEHDPNAASVLVTASRDARRRGGRRAGAPGAGDQAHRAHPHGARRPAVRRRARRATSTTGSRSSTPTPPSTWRSRPRDAAAVAARVRNAGAVFVGPWSPVSLGDYCAGSNHVLPTGGCARHSAGLSVQTFLRGVHVVEYTEEALREAADRVLTLAAAEDLPAHGQAASSAPRSRQRRDAPSTWSTRRPAPERHPRPAAAARRPARQDALRRPAARRRGAPQHQREPVPAAARAGGRRHSGRAPRPPRSCTATPTATPAPCAPTSPPTSPRPPACRSTRRTSGRPTAPTRCSSRCCRRSAGRGGWRWASSRPTRCTRSSPGARAPSGCPRRAAPISPSTSTPRPSCCRAKRPTSRS